MKALVKTRPGPGLELIEVPTPAVGAGDVLVKVKATGICGTDLHIESWDEWAQKTLELPVTVGHEFSGEVVQIGSGVTDVAVGDLVSGEGHLVCGRCRNCRAGRRHLCIHTRAIGVHLDGAFAEYVALPSGNVWVHRDPIDPGSRRSSTRSVMPCTPRSHFPCLARMSWSQEPDRSASWRPW